VELWWRIRCSAVVVRAKKNGTWEKNRRKLKEKQQKTGGDFTVRTCPYEFPDQIPVIDIKRKANSEEFPLNKISNY
jgi:hypothetical protein